MNECENPTCTRPPAPGRADGGGARARFCSRRCQLAARKTPSGRYHLTVPLPMTLLHELEARAELDGLELVDLVLEVLVDEALA